MGSEHAAAQDEEGSIVGYDAFLRPLAVLRSAGSGRC